jgi:VWFA-related protein
MVCLAASALAQENPKIVSNTRLVLVPAVAHDKSGNHASGLTKDQFKLSQDGKEQTISVFQEVKALRQRLEPIRSQGEFTNSIAKVNEAHSLTIIAVDLINTPPQAVTYLKDDLLKYIGKMADNGDPTALVTLDKSGVKVVYDFTTDPKQLAAAVKHISGRPVAGQTNASATVNARPSMEAVSPDATIGPEGLLALENQLTNWVNIRVTEDRSARFQQAQTRRDTLDSMRAVATALKSLPGRKSLVWVSAGFPYAEDNLQLQAKQGEMRGGANGVNMQAGAPTTTQTGTTGTGGTGTGGTGTGGTGTGTGTGTGSGTGTVVTGGSGISPTRTNPLGEGLPYGEMGRGPSQLELGRGVPSSEAMNDHTNAWGALNDANIAVYPVDARRLVNTSFDVMSPDQKYSSQAIDRELAYNKASEFITTFENMAAATGGKPCYSRTDLYNCFREAVDDGASYYMLGYYLPEKTKGGWHKLQVKTSIKDVNIRSRNGFVYNDAKTDTRLLIQADLAAALKSSMNAFGVPLYGSFLDTTERNGKKAVKFELRIPWDGLTVDQENGSRMALDIAAIAFDSSGKPAGSVGQTLDSKLPPQAIAQIQQGGMRYRNTIELPAGEYKVRFVVRDNLTGRLGSVESPLTVR